MRQPGADAAAGGAQQGPRSCKQRPAQRPRGPRMQQGARARGRRTACTGSGRAGGYYVQVSSMCSRTLYVQWALRCGAGAKCGAESPLGSPRAQLPRADGAEHARTRRGAAPRAPRPAARLTHAGPQHTTRQLDQRPVPAALGPGIERVAPRNRCRSPSPPIMNRCSHAHAHACGRGGLRCTDRCAGAAGCAACALRGARHAGGPPAAAGRGADPRPPEARAGGLHAWAWDAWCARQKWGCSRRRRRWGGARLWAPYFLVGDAGAASSRAPALQQRNQSARGYRGAAHTCRPRCNTGVRCSMVFVPAARPARYGGAWLGRSTRPPRAAAAGAQQVSFMRVQMRVQYR